MKKNITINIFGTVYSIDEDAYVLLNNYLEGMKSYFSNQDDCNEVADDIEHRVAELLWEKKEQGMEAVDIATVKEIIDKIGKPVEIDDGSSTFRDGTGSSSAAAAGSVAGDETGESDEADGFFDRIKHHVRTRRLYRDTQNKVFGGVCSGLSEYFGFGDVTLWRLAFIFLTLFFGSYTMWFIPHFMNGAFPVIYLILWLIVPEVKTSEDRLRMKGKQVTPENLTEQIVQDVESNRPVKGSGSSSRGGGCLKLIFFVILFFMIMPLFAVLFAVVVALVVLALSGLGYSSVMFLNTDAVFLHDIISNSGSTLWIGLSAALIVILIPIYAIIRAVRGTFRKLSSTTIITLAVVWIITLAVSVSMLSVTGASLSKFFKTRHAIECTRNGITLASLHSWSDLDMLGWELKKLKNIYPHITSNRTGFAGMPKRSLHIRRDTVTKPASILLARQESLDAGKYVLEAICEVEGRGVEMKVSDADGNTLTVLTPADNARQLTSMTWDDARALPLFFNPDSTEWEHFRQRDTSWSYVVSEPFDYNGGTVTLTIGMDDAYVDRCNIRHIQLRKL